MMVGDEPYNCWKMSAIGSIHSCSSCYVIFKRSYCPNQAVNNDTPAL